MPASERPLPRDHVGSLAKGLSVLEILASHPAGLTLTAVSELAGMDRAGARRLLITLETEGYAALEDRRYRLSPKLITLARSFIASTPLWTHAEPFMREASAALGESCSAAVLAGQDIVYVARVAGRAIMTVSLDVGSRLPAWCTSMGRVLLADLDDAARAALLDGVMLTARTQRTITRRDALEAEIGKVGALGYAIIDEELEMGLRTIAVPVRNRSGRAVAAINISTTPARFSPRELETEVLPVLRRTAEAIESHFLAG